MNFESIIALLQRRCRVQFTALFLLQSMGQTGAFDMWRLLFHVFVLGHLGEMWLEPCKWYQVLWNFHCLSITCNIVCWFYKFNQFHFFSTKADYDKRRGTLSIVRRQYNVTISMALWHIDCELFFCLLISFVVSLLISTFIYHWVVAI